MTKALDPRGVPILFVAAQLPLILLFRGYYIASFVTLLVLIWLVRRDELVQAYLSVAELRNCLLGSVAFCVLSALMGLLIPTLAIVLVLLWFVGTIIANVYLWGLIAERK